MDYGRFLIFLCAGGWLYAAVMTAFADWRWNFGRIVQYALCAAFAGWLIVTRRTGLNPVDATLLLASAMLFLPFFLQRRIHKLLSRGDVRAARRWELAWSLVLWRPRSAVFPAIEPIYAAAARSLPARSAEGALSGRWLDRLIGGPSRKAFVENQINAWAALGEYRTAAGLFEEHFGAGKMSPSAELLYTMVVPYAEAGGLRKAVQCLRRGEETPDAPNPLDLRRLVAYLHVYAQAGRTYAFERMAEHHAQAVAALPPGYVRLLRGVALLRHGEPEAARNVLASALMREPEGETRLRRTAEPYLAAAQGAPAPVELEADTAADLDAVERLEERSSIPDMRVFIPTAAWRPLASWALIAACVAAWLLTESYGSSEDSYTLANFGANVPGLVKLGDWWRLVSSIFLHVGLMHLAFNMYALYLFGPFVERLAGRWPMFVIFMFTGICGSAASAWYGNAALSAGASGAIFGLLGAATAIGLTFHNIPRHVRKIYLFNFLFIAALQFAYGHFEPHIDNLAHAGGYVAGALAGFFLRPAGMEGRRKSVFHVAGLLLLAVAAASLIAVFKNVEAGGYPGKIPALSRHVAPDGAWTIKVPTFWSETPLSVTQHKPRAKPDEVLDNLSAVRFDDPLGAELKISGPRGLLRLAPAPGEAVQYDGPCPIGKYVYQEIKTTVQVDSKHKIGRFLFLASEGGVSYVLEFECEAEQMNNYEKLLARILFDFDIRKTAPIERTPPKWLQMFEPAA